MAIITRRRTNTVLLVDESADTAALTEPVPVTSKPSNALDCLGFASVALKFLLTGDANDVSNIQVIRWTECGEGVQGATLPIYVPTIAAKGSVVAGATVGTIAGYISATALICDHIFLEKADHGVELFSPGADSTAILHVALDDAKWLTVQTDLAGGAPTKTSVVATLSDEPLANVQRSLAGGYLTFSMVATADQTILEAAVPAGAEVMGFEVRNTDAAHDFDAFAIERKIHYGGTTETVASAAGDYAVPQFPLLTCSFDDDPVTLNGNSSSVWVTMDVRGVGYVRIAGSCEAGQEATVKVWWRFF